VASHTADEKQRKILLDAAEAYEKKAKALVSKN
jgi:hypothetical protein